MFLKKGSYARSFLVFVVILAAREAQAGGVARMLVDNSGNHSIALSSNDRPIQLKTGNLCGSSYATKAACFKWKLISTDPSDTSELLTITRQALSKWTSISTANIGFEEKTPSTGSDFSLPAEDSNHNPIGVDYFYIAFPRSASELPSGIHFEEDQVVVTKLYVRPDIQNGVGEIRWAGIYFNPNLKSILSTRPNGNYFPIPALLSQIGIALGLAPSAIKNSALYSARNLKTENIQTLGEDDKLWLSATYPAGTFLSTTAGSISGKVLKGEDGSGWVGAHVSLIKKDDQSKIENATISTPLRSLNVVGAITQEDGNYKIPAVDPGEYFVFVEPLNAAPFNLNQFDEATRALATSGSFVQEFDDGGGRESNQEAIAGSSQQAIVYAALIKVVAGKETREVDIITNVSDPKIAAITAKGSTNETLSSVVAADIVRTFPSKPLQIQSEGGCSLQMKTQESSFTTGFIFLILFSISGFALCRSARRRWDSTLK